MKQELKSKRSKEIILAAGLKLFSSQGYKATSLKEISQEAGISTGRIYHHFDSKLQIFTALLEEYWERLKDPDLKLNRLTAESRFPEDFEDMVHAIQEVVMSNKAYIMLIYIDVIEFHGEHIQRFYRNMAERFRAAYGERFEQMKQEGLFAKDADPLFAIMLVVRFFFQYFLVETSFGVEDHFGYSADEVIQKAKTLLLGGLMNGGKDQ